MLKRTQWAGFEGLSCNTHHPTAVILFHGFGANDQDLAPLSQILDLNHEISWYFPDGLLPLPFPYGQGRCWFPLDVALLQKKVQRGEHDFLAEQCPPEFVASSERLDALITYLQGQHERLVLGGFSQGALMALDLALRHSQGVHALILLSANLLARARTEKLLRANAPQWSVWQTHGESDPILPFASAQKLHQLLKAHLTDCTFLPFKDGHTIPPQLFAPLRDFIARWR